MRFCVHCGRQLRDDEVCACQQGDKKSTAAEAAKDAFGKAEKWIKNDKTQGFFKKYWPYIAGGVALIIVAVVLCCTLGGSSYKTPVNDIIQTFNDQVTDVVKIARRILPGFVETDAYSMYQSVRDNSYVEDMLDEAKDGLKDIYDNLEDYYGRDMVFSYEITDKDAMSKRQLSRTQDDLRDLSDYLKDAVDQWDDMDKDEQEDASDEADLTVKELEGLARRLEKLAAKIEKAKVSKGYELTVTVMIEGRDEDDEFEDLTLNVIKVNGDWMIDVTSFDDSTALDLIADLF